MGEDDFNLMVHVEFFDVEKINEYDVLQSGSIVLRVTHYEYAVTLTTRKGEIVRDPTYAKGTKIGVCRFS